jgi:hypothetical protein
MSILRADVVLCWNHDRRPGLTRAEPASANARAVPELVGGARAGVYRRIRTPKPTGSGTRQASLTRGSVLLVAAFLDRRVAGLGQKPGDTLKEALEEFLSLRIQ